MTPPPRPDVRVGDIYRIGDDVRRVGEIKGTQVWWHRPRGYDGPPGQHFARWCGLYSWARWVKKAQLIERGLPG